MPRPAVAGARRDRVGVAARAAGGVGHAAMARVRIRRRGRRSLRRPIAAGMGASRVDAPLDGCRGPATSGRRGEAASAERWQPTTADPLRGAADPAERHPSLAPFAAYLDDPDVTDLFVNGADRAVRRPRRRRGRRRREWRATEEDVRDLAVALIGLGGRHIDDATPCVDVRLEGGIRVHAVLPPVAAEGTAISIRVPRLGRGRRSTMLERARHVRRRRARAGSSERDRAAREPARHGRGRRGQDDAAGRAARGGSRARADRHDRGRRRAAHRPSPSRASRGASGQPRGRGRHRPGAAGARGAAHAPRPARGRRVPWRRGARAALGAQHRPRRRRGHACTRTACTTCPRGSRRSAPWPGSTIARSPARSASAIGLVLHVERGADGVAAPRGGRAPGARRRRPARDRGGAMGRGMTKRRAMRTGGRARRHRFAPAVAAAAEAVDLLADGRRRRDGAAARGAAAGRGRSGAGVGAPRAQRAIAAARARGVVDRRGMPLPQAIATRRAAAPGARSGAPGRSRRPSARRSPRCLRGLAAALRDAQEAADDVRVALAEPAGTARLMGWLPLVAVGLGAALGFDTFGDPVRRTRSASPASPAAPFSSSSHSAGRRRAGPQRADRAATSPASMPS